MTVFINEFHYDNEGTDVGEFIEGAGSAGTDLTGWSIALYNGANGALYDTLALSGVLADAGEGFGFTVIDLPVNGLQNGEPDGLALVDDAGAVVEFLSYEGAFTAVGGPADGMTSSDVGVEETGGTLTGQSLQRVGAGVVAGDFVFAGPSADTRGAANTGQSFDDGDGGGGDGPAFVINEIDADTPGTDAAEFIEIWDGGAGGASLDGLALVLFNGSDDASYDAFDLDGFVTDENGFFVIGSADVANVDLVGFTTNGLQNGADAVALYAGDAPDFPNDAPLTTAGLLDAVVYATSDADDSGLLDVYGGPQVDEDANGASDAQSLSRARRRRFRRAGADARRDQWRGRGAAAGRGADQPDPGLLRRRHPGRRRRPQRLRRPGRHHPGDRDRRFPVRRQRPDRVRPFGLFRAGGGERLRR